MWIVIIGIAAGFIFGVGIAELRHAIRDNKFDGVVLCNDISHEYPWQIHVDIPFEEIKKRNYIILEVHNQTREELEKIQEEENAKN